MINVMIVEDSFFMRAIIKDILNQDENINVYKEAKNGEEAIKFLDDKVDVVLLDIEMPKKTGIDVLKEWEKNDVAVPVIMFSSLTKDGADETIAALDLGAFDFIEKPSTKFDVSKQAEEIVEKIKLAADIGLDESNNKIKKNRVVKKQTNEEKYKKSKELEKLKKNSKETKVVKNVVMIGCSTGGPRALKEILPMFPSDTNAVFLVVQHMPKGGFIDSLARSLNNESKLKVKVAKHRETIENGTVYIAPSGYQMHLDENNTLSVEERSAVSGHTPSVDYLFDHTYPTHKKYNLLPVVLTGMGADGSNAVLKYSRIGIKTVVESEKTTAVYGMPKKVVDSGAKHIVLPLTDIPEYIIRNIQ